VVKEVGFEGCEVDMEADEEEIKVPQLKRRSQKNSQAKIVVVSTGGRGAAEDESSMEEDSAADSQVAGVGLVGGWGPKDTV